MGRLRCIVALMRVLVVAVSLCLVGAFQTHAQAQAALESATFGPAHIDAADLPDPGTALTEERDEDDRTAEDDTRLGPRPHLVVLPATAHRVILARGPPVHPRPITGRPRSSRGPPVQV